MARSRIGGVGAIVVGVALFALGGAGLAGAGPLAAPAAITPSQPTTPTSRPATAAPSEPGGGASPSAAATPIATTPASATPAPSPSADPMAIVSAFYARLIPAIRNVDVATMLGLLHSATIERYGEAACRTYLAGLRDAAFNVVVRAVHPPAPWAWERDGLSTTIPEAWAVDADLTANGVTASAEIHVALVGGEVRWFTDCGTPQGPPASP